MLKSFLIQVAFSLQRVSFVLFFKSSPGILDLKLVILESSVFTCCNFKLKWYIQRKLIPQLLISESMKFSISSLCQNINFLNWVIFMTWPLKFHIFCIDICNVVLWLWISFVNIWEKKTLSFWHYVNWDTSNISCFYVISVQVGITTIAIDAKLHWPIESCFLKLKFCYK